MRHERKNNLFKSVPIPKVKRNLFDLSHEVKMSGKFGYIYPVLLLETMPGDTIRDEMSTFVRFAPMLAPIMHRCDVTSHAFFVPMRLVYGDDVWQDFITGGQDGLDNTVLPYVTPAGLVANFSTSDFCRKGQLWDYLGLPVAPASADSITSTEHISIAPFRAVAKVWNDYYRDPNLQEEIDLGLETQGDVSNHETTYELMYGLDIGVGWLRRGFEKDYFTSALPFAQRGAQVLMPMSAVIDGDDITYSDSAIAFGYAGNVALGSQVQFSGSSPSGMVVDDGNTGTNRKGFGIENIDEINIESATTTINDFRRAMAIQRWLENNARGGGRYIEQIESHFNERVPDYRLQRAEYLGGGKQPVQISEVLATAESEVGSAVTSVGDMAGHGISVGGSNRFTYRCQEHGYVVMFLSVTFRTAYQQGIPRLFSHESKFDFPWPELANLGEQEIKSKELFYAWEASDDEANQALFGYIPRYAEYKYQPDRVAGDFRDNLLFWHLGRVFDERPVLQWQFTTLIDNGTGYETPFTRIFAVQDGTDYLWMQLYHRCTALRPLPYFGVPVGL